MFEAIHWITKIANQRVMNAEVKGEFIVSRELVTVLELLSDESSLPLVILHPIIACLQSLNFCETF
jgi:hypothetical protein